MARALKRCELQKLYPCVTDDDTIEIETSTGIEKQKRN